MQKSLGDRRFAAQISRIVDAGIAPTHLDTHKHTHLLPMKESREHELQPLTAPETRQSLALRR